MGWRSGDSGNPGRYPIVQRQALAVLGKANAMLGLAEVFAIVFDPCVGKGG